MNAREWAIAILVTVVYGIGFYRGLRQGREMQGDK
jgi:hypothetical protein